MTGFDVNSPKLVMINETGEWKKDEGRVSISDGRVVIAAGGPLYGVQLIYETAFERGARFFGDAWERGYGDLEWRGLIAERLMPWYMQVDEGGRQSFVGVMTGPAAFAGIRAAARSVTVDIDARSCGGPVRLEGRALEACTLVAEFNHEGPAFQFQRTMLKRLCPAARLAKEPVYGGNNWYYAYGDSSREHIIADAQFMARMAGGNADRPYMVIDVGWQQEAAVPMRAGEPIKVPDYGGPWVSNEFYGDMATLSRRMQDEGVKPGIWIRPLYESVRPKADWVLVEAGGHWTLDPSNPEVLNYIAGTVKRLNSDGYTLVKPDFTTYDIFGHWGFQVRGKRMGAGRRMADDTRTNAEIIRELYRVIADAAGENLVIGCNTVGHLAAGLFQIQRTGDDTSGRHWERTRYMGLNTLAMRMPQHRIFYDCDADCSPITDAIDWTLARRWLDVLSRSGTPLFVSVKPGSLDGMQECALKEAFSRAAANTEPAEPLDWQDATAPRIWKSAYGVAEYDFDAFYVGGADDVWWQ